MPVLSKNCVCYIFFKIVKSSNLVMYIIFEVIGIGLLFRVD